MPFRRRLLFCVVTAIAVPTSFGYAQQVISAQSGTVHYTEGAVYENGHALDHKFGQFPTLKGGEELRTANGRAEVLLTPGAFLRLGENSSVRMLSNRLSDTRVEVLSGAVMVECAELLPSNSLTLVYRNTAVKLEKRGLYGLDADQARFRVYDGHASVRSDTRQIDLKKGEETALNGTLHAQRFDTRLNDNLFTWSRERSGYLAYASASAAQSLRSSGMAWVGGWGWSPLLDEFTFVPVRGIVYSPFGWEYWSPLITGVYYYVPPYYYPGYYSGASGGASRAGGWNGGRNGAAAGSETAPPAGVTAARHAPVNNSGSAGGFGGGARGPAGPGPGFNGGGFGGGRAGGFGGGGQVGGGSSNVSFGGAGSAHAAGGHAGGESASGRSAK